MLPPSDTVLIYTVLVLPAMRKHDGKTTAKLEVLVHNIAILPEED